VTALDTSGYDDDNTNSSNSSSKAMSLQRAYAEELGQGLIRTFTKRYFNELMPRIQVPSQQFVSLHFRNYLEVVVLALSSISYAHVVLMNY
jgi:hypothetical protein